MDVISDDAKGDYRRVEVLTGPSRRRRWSAEEKGRIVAETLQAGARVSDVARRWQVCAQQVWGWRREAREGHLTLPAAAVASNAAAEFIPIVADAAPGAMDEASAASRSRPASSRVSLAAVEIRLAGAVVRVVPGTDAVLLATALRALRNSA